MAVGRQVAAKRSAYLEVEWILWPRFPMRTEQDSSLAQRRAVQHSHCTLSPVPFIEQAISNQCQIQNKRDCPGKQSN